MDKPKRIARTRRLRQASPVTERLLWDLVRDRRLEGLKFRRQVAIGPYVADFVCLRHRLIVEADNPYFHDVERDAIRDAWLRDQGFRVLRFTNSQIHGDTDLVLDAIAEAATGETTRRR